jgi:hypothetical protein
LIVRPLTGEKKLPPPVVITATGTFPAVKPVADAVMVAEPILRPFTIGCAVGYVVWASIKTLDVTVAVEVSLLTSETVTPPAGAGADKVICRGAAWFTPTVTPVGSTIDPVADCATVTLAVAPVVFAALAVIVAVPDDTPETGTERLVLPWPKFTNGGTVATAALLELRLTKSPGTGGERFKVRFCVAIPLIVRLAGEKLSVAVAVVPPPVTCTWELAFG